MTSHKMGDDDDNKSSCYHNNVTSSIDDSSSFTSVRFLAPVAALVAFNLIVIVGNSLVIAAVFTYRALRTVTNTFIVSLAVADLLLGAVVLPFSSVNEILGWWPFGRIWCSAWLAIDVWVCTASILNLCAISLDRYLAISRPFRYPLLMSPTRAKVAVAVVWTLALAICLPPLLGWRDSEVANVTVASTAHRCSFVNVDYDFDRSAKSTGRVTASGKKRNRSLTQNSTSNDSYRTAGARFFGAHGYQSAILNRTRHSTAHSVLTQERFSSTRFASPVSRRIARAMYNKRGGGASNSAARKTNRISAGSAVECDGVKNGKTADWNFVSDLPIDSVPATAASFNACRWTLF